MYPLTKKRSLRMFPRIDEEESETKKLERKNSVPSEPLRESLNMLEQENGVYDRLDSHSPLVSPDMTHRKTLPRKSTGVLQDVTGNNKKNTKSASLTKSKVESEKTLQKLSEMRTQLEQNGLDQPSNVLTITESREMATGRGFSRGISADDETLRGRSEEVTVTPQEHEEKTKELMYKMELRHQEVLSTMAEKHDKDLKEGRMQFEERKAKQTAANKAKAQGLAKDLKDTLSCQLSQRQKDETRSFTETAEDMKKKIGGENRATLMELTNQHHQKLTAMEAEHQKAMVEQVALAVSTRAEVMTRTHKARLEQQTTDLGIQNNREKRRVLDETESERKNLTDERRKYEEVTAKLEDRRIVREGSLEFVDLFKDHAKMPDFASEGFILDTPESQPYSIGDRVRSSGHRNCIIRFIGETDFAPGTFAGLELETQEGTSNGSIDGKEYFNCRPAYGLFVEMGSLEKETYSTSVKELKHVSSLIHTLVHGYVEMQDPTSCDQDEDVRLSQAETDRAASYMSDRDNKKKQEVAQLQAEHDVVMEEYDTERSILEEITQKKRVLDSLRSQACHQKYGAEFSHRHKILAFSLLLIFCFLLYAGTCIWLYREWLFHAM